MGPAELVWRLGQRARLAAWSKRVGVPVPALPRPAEGFHAAFLAASEPLAPGPSREAFAAALEGALPGEAARVIACSDAIRAGRIELFDRTCEFGPEPARWPWNRSPDGGPDAPMAFGPALDYRDPARVGDARLAWELGRHGFLVPVAQAGYLAGDPGCTRFVFEALEAWIDTCPPYRGLQWASALEYALRSLSWGLALALVARTPGAETIDDARWERVLATWAEQLRFVDAHDARHSSANNHRLGEAAGLAFGGRLLAFLPEAARWREHGLKVLEESFLEQTTAGGITREHAFAYQHFVLDFVLAVHGLEARAGQATPPAVLERVRSVAAMLDRVSPGGLTWPVGDGDEGQALPTGEPFEARVSATLECAAGLTRTPWSGEGFARARWLSLVPAAGNGPAGANESVRAEAGYMIAQRGAARLLFDAAELGLAPLYAHGHADALMVLLDVRGPRLVDPGTGGYHAHAELRERLRATAAHNTVEIDGESSSIPGGLFQWLRAARVFDRRLEANEYFEWCAEHDGYRRLKGGVVHQRTVRWLEPGRLVVEDALKGAGRHCARTRWHLGDGRAVARGKGGAAFEARWPDGFTLALEGELPAGATGRAGDDATWAPRFLAPRPCGYVEWIVEGRLPLKWRTTIRWTEGGLRKGSA